MSKTSTVEKVERKPELGVAADSLWNLQSRAASPWINRPFRLTSWMEILRFSAARFCSITTALVEIEKVLDSPKLNEKIAGVTRDSLTRFVSEINYPSEQIEFVNARSAIAKATGLSPDPKNTSDNVEKTNE